MTAPNVLTLLAAKIDTGAGSTIKADQMSATRAFQVYGAVSASTGAAEVRIDGSNDGTHWEALGTVTLTLGTTDTSGGFAGNAPWPFLRAYVVSISGTDAEVSATVGGQVS